MVRSAQCCDACLIMSKNKTWNTPGWPWEMDLLCLVFVVIALAAPYYYFTASTGEEITRTLMEQRHVLWAIGITVLFVMHLAVSGTTLETISTPFLHLLSPMAFAVLAYYRTFSTIQQTAHSSPLNGSALQYALVAVSVLILSLVMARIRMARQLLRFRDIKWDLVCKSPYDRTYFQLITEFQPLVYPPRLVRACSEGVLIEGWYYLMPLPFSMFQGLAPVAGIRHAANGRYIASSTRNLVRIELLDNAEPLYISLENRAEFLNYCARHIAHLRAHTTGSPNRTRDTASGTHAGAARGTASGTSRGSARKTFYNKLSANTDSGSA